MPNIYVSSLTLHLALCSILWTLALFPLDRYATRARLAGTASPAAAAAAAAAAAVEAGKASKPAAAAPAPAAAAPAAPAGKWAAFRNYSAHVVTEVRPGWGGGERASQAEGRGR
jgi:hypothetical protein